jgi:hypothetical protein
VPNHSVKQGDTLISIASEHGFPSWETIWMDPGNAELRKKRDPQVLTEGDSVVVPEKKMRAVLLQTDQKHTLVVPTIKAFCRVVLHDTAGEPLANRRFQLEVGGQLKHGVTDSSGRIDMGVDPKASDGKLKLFLDDSDPTNALTWSIKLGHLNPIDKVSGVKARLSNLGFLCGTIDETLNDDTKTALRNFQIVHRLPLTGEADELTKNLLLTLHDKR